jgi:response regulator RpfG family c-di-GMP phosphodiesterase
MIDEKQALHKVLRLSQEMSKYRDLDILLEQILTLAREFVQAEAGSIYLHERSSLRFWHTQNDSLQKSASTEKKWVYSTFSIPIDHRSIAGYVAETGEILNIDDAYQLPPGVPYAFNREYDQQAAYRTQSVLTFPLKMYHGTVLGVLQLINARDRAGNIRSFSKEEEPFVMHVANSAAISIERAQLTRALILRSITMAEMRDPKETGPHVNRVGAYAAEIYQTWATKQGITAAEIHKNKDVLRMGAMLHDVGKVAISDSILKKPGRFEDWETAIMQQHAHLGAKIFMEQFSDLDEAAFIVALNHHERWDGKGYPGHVNLETGAPLAGYEAGNGRAQGKRGEEIPLFGRIAAIADVYDALSCKRVYKEAWEEDRVLETLRQEAGAHFDPEMIDAFFMTLETIRQIAKRYPESRAT